MFYAKEKLGESAELAVDLAAVFADGEGDLASTAVLCAHCTAEVMGGKTDEV